jgi:hypothetical protein
LAVKVFPSADKQTLLPIITDNTTDIEQIKTPSFELAEIEHIIAVNRLMKKGIKTPYFERTDEQMRPEVSKNNPYLYGAANFNEMLPGTVD